MPRTASELRAKFGEMITVGQLCELAEIQPDTFRSYVSRGFAPGPDSRLGKNWIFTPETAAAFLDGSWRGRSTKDSAENP